MKYNLVIEIAYATGSCHDDKSITFCEEIRALNRESAVDKAKKLIQNYHKKYCHLTDYGLHAELLKPIWKTQFEEEILAHSAIPATLGRKARFKENIMR